MDKERYSQYLSDPRWRSKREEIITLHNHKCDNCNESNRLQVHHKQYLDSKMPWEYASDYYKVLCEKCHSNEHGIKYVEKQCKQCGINISAIYEYCFSCNKTLLKNTETENQKLKNEKKVSDIKFKQLFLKTEIENEENSRLKSNLNTMLREKQNLETKRKELSCKEQELQNKQNAIKREKEEFENKRKQLLLKTEIENGENNRLKSNLNTMLLEKQNLENRRNELNNKEQQIQLKHNTIEREKEEFENKRKELSRKEQELQDKQNTVQGKIIGTVPNNRGTHVLAFSEQADSDSTPEEFIRKTITELCKSDYVSCEQHKHLFLLLCQKFSSLDNVNLNRKIHTIVKQMKMFDETFSKDSLKRNIQIAAKNSKITKSNFNRIINAAVKMGMNKETAQITANEEVHRNCLKVTLF